MQTCQLSTLSIVVILLCVSITEGKPRWSYTRRRLNGRQFGRQRQTIDQVIEDAGRESKTRAGQNRKIAEDLDMEAKGDIVLSELDMMFTKADFERLNRFGLERTQNNRNNRLGQGNGAINRNRKGYGGNLRKSMRGKRAAAVGSHRFWPDAVVPYAIDDALAFSEEERARFDAAIADISRYTCIVWRPKVSSDTNYVSVEDRSGCWSYIGKQRFASQPMSLASRCRRKGVIVHEMMHALGAYHEQSRTDRDDYVTIDMTNVRDSGVSNYAKKSADQQEVYDVPYDYESVMHYGPYTFAKNYSSPVITTIDPAMQRKIGNREGLNFHDIHLLNHMYGCTDHCAEKTCPSGAYVGKDCKCWCPTGDLTDPVRECNDQDAEESTSQSSAPSCDAIGSACQCSAAPSTACSNLAYTVCSSDRCVCQSDYYLSSGQCLLRSTTTTTTTTTTTPKTTTSSTKTEGMCENKYSKERCEAWVDLGYCTHSSYGNWMDSNCHHACTCSQQTSSAASDTCADEKSSCGVWSSRGYCDTTSTYHSYMMRYCALSCGSCVTSTSSDSSCSCS